MSNGAGYRESGPFAATEGGSGYDGFKILAGPAMCRPRLVDMLDERFDGFASEARRKYSALCGSDIAQNANARLFHRGGQMPRQAIGASSCPTAEGEDVQVAERQVSHKLNCVFEGPLILAWEPHN